MVLYVYYKYMCLLLLYCCVRYICVNKFVLDRYFSDVIINNKLIKLFFIYFKNNKRIFWKKFLSFYGLFLLCFLNIFFFKLLLLLMCIMCILVRVYFWLINYLMDLINISIVLIFCFYYCI